MSSVWTVCYTQPSRYNSMLQYYLRAADLGLSWVGTGTLIFGLKFSDADFSDFAERFVGAGRSMRDDGWRWSNPALTNKRIKRRILRGVLILGEFTGRSRR